MATLHGKLYRCFSVIFLQHFFIVKTVREKWIMFIFIYVYEHYFLLYIYTYILGRRYRHEHDGNAVDDDYHRWYRSTVQIWYGEETKGRVVLRPCLELAEQPNANKYNIYPPPSVFLAHPYLKGGFFKLLYPTPTAIGRPATSALHDVSGYDLSDKLKIKSFANTVVKTFMRYDMVGPDSQTHRHIRRRNSQWNVIIFLLFLKFYLKCTQINWSIKLYGRRCNYHLILCYQLSCLSLVKQNSNSFILIHHRRDSIDLFIFSYHITSTTTLAACPPSSTLESTQFSSK